MNVVATRPNIRAAIERSRRARDAFARRRRRAAIAAGLCIAASVPASLALIGVTGSDVVQAAETGARSLADLMSQRSPGARTAAELTKTKRTRHALAKLRHPAAPPAPATEELAKVLLPPAQQLPVDLGPPMALLQAPTPPFEAIAGPPAGGIIGSPGGVPSGSPGGVPGGSPGACCGSPGGPGGSPPGGGPPIVPTPQVPSAVPEPGTWATMLLGFGLLGWRVRRGHKARPITALA